MFIKWQHFATHNLNPGHSYPVLCILLSHKMQQYKHGPSVEKRTLLQFAGRSVGWHDISGMAIWWGESNAFKICICSNSNPRDLS